MGNDYLKKNNKYKKYETWIVSECMNYYESDLETLQYLVWYLVSVYRYWNIIVCKEQRSRCVYD